MARNQLSPYRGGEMTRGSDPFVSLHREMNRLFDDVFRGFGMPMTGPMTGRQGERGEGGLMMMQPDIDVTENEKEFKICADLPGVSEQDVDVQLNDDVLTIKAERKHENKEDKEDYHLVERSYGMFQRSLRLPSNIDAGRCDARFENGVLTIKIPKAEDGQRSRRIQIQGGQSAGRNQDQGGQSAGRNQDQNQGQFQGQRQDQSQGQSQSKYGREGESKQPGSGQTRSSARQRAQADNGNQPRPEGQHAGKPQGGDGNAPGQGEQPPGTARRGQ